MVDETVQNVQERIGTQDAVVQTALQKYEPIKALVEKNNMSGSLVPLLNQLVDLELSESEIEAIALIPDAQVQGITTKTKAFLNAIINYYGEELTSLHGHYDQFMAFQEHLEEVEEFKNDSTGRGFNINYRNCFEIVHALGKDKFYQLCEKLAEYENKDEQEILRKAPRVILSLIKESKETKHNIETLLDYRMAKIPKSCFKGE